MSEMTHNDGTKLIRFGIIADLQYYDGPPFKNRYFRKSKEKLKKAIESFNTSKLDFVVNLGDTIDRHWESYEEILTEFQNLDPMLYHVLGNHDYEVVENKYPDVHKILGIPPYYSFTISGWRFIVLNGNEISTFSNVPDSEQFKKAETWLDQMNKAGKVNGQIYNGGIGPEQLNWLEEQLAAAAALELKVIVFCHYPLYPENKHNLLNSDEVRALLQKSDMIKAFFCGHNHKGNYGQLSDVHFVNMKGMVEGEKNMVYAIVSLSNNYLSIRGFRNEISARLSI